MRVAVLVAFATAACTSTDTAATPPLPMPSPSTSESGGDGVGKVPNAASDVVDADGVGGLVEAVTEAGRLAGLLSAGVFSDWCALGSDGVPACWGVLAEDPPQGPFAAVSVGLVSACGLRSGGGVECWEIWTGGEADSLEGSFVAVNSGGFRSCGLRPGGTLACWEQHPEAWGDGSWDLWPDDDWLSWVPVHPVGVFEAVSVGYAHVCGLRPGGSVECWGEDWFGQSNSPPGRFLAVDAGVSHSCGLRPDGSVECWGEDSIDAGYFGFSEDRYEESYRESLSGIRDDGVSLGEVFGFLTVDGAVLGEGMVGVLVERAARWEPPVGPFKAVSAGAGFTCGLRVDGEVDCWGYVAGGESRIPVGIFSEVAGGRVRDLLAAEQAELQRHLAERDASHRGANGERTSDDNAAARQAQLDLSFARFVYEAVLGHIRVVDPPAGPFVAIDAGRQQVCGLRPSGEVQCWGVEYPESLATPPPSGRFASEALALELPPVLTHDGALVEAADAAGGGASGADGSAGLSEEWADVEVSLLTAGAPEASRPPCGDVLAAGGALASLVDPRLREVDDRFLAGPFAPGDAVQLVTSFLRPNSAVRLWVVGGAVPLGGEPVGDIGSLRRVALPAATADSRGELSVSWVAPAAPPGRVGPMWYLVSGQATWVLTHQDVELGLVNPIIVYPDVAPCAVDDEATTTAGVAVRVDVLTNDTAPTGGVLDPASVAVVHQTGGRFVANRADGSLRFTPEAGFVGTARARYVVYDSWNIGAPADVTVTVKAD